MHKYNGNDMYKGTYMGGGEYGWFSVLHILAVLWVLWI